MKVVGKVLGSSHKNFSNGVENINWGTLRSSRKASNVCSLIPVDHISTKICIKLFMKNLKFEMTMSEILIFFLIFHNLNSKVHWCIF